MPPLRYPPIPLPSAPINMPQNGSAMNDAPHTNTAVVNGLDFHAASSQSSRLDGDREEGELTDMEGGKSAKSKSEMKYSRRTNQKQAASTRSSQRGKGSHASRASHGQNTSEMDLDMPRTNTQNSVKPAAKASGKASSDLEEGEASSSESSSSSRATYNPPMSISANSLAPHEQPGAQRDASIPPLEQAPQEQALSHSHESHEIPAVKSLAQLRVQAQGALLSLAPHNIRYSELVGEGINPAVLKQLYEEVGIKVATPQREPSPEGPPPKSAVVPEGLSGLEHDQQNPLTAIPEPVGQRARAEIPGHAKQEAQQSRVIETNAVAVPSTTQPDTTKPMERKEVIARMLAAKAAKASGSSASPQTDTPKPPSAAPAEIQNMDKPASTTPSDASAKEKEAPAREKNKAQTELARQRIEQLKKQGLMRAQQRSQPDSFAQEKPQPGIEISEVSAPPPAEPLAIQHPLPERPPEPESGTPARIPGLFMTESEPSPPRDSFVTPAQGISLDSTPQPRASQRKRPRASDFDEPVNVPTWPFSQGAEPPVPEDKLIIDISDDDEFYGDDENDVMDMDTSADQTPQESSLSGFAREFIPQNPMNHLLSKSSTPQYLRNSEQEDLRKKELEIQQMRRQIAEMEQRKKAKLTASGTQSPCVLNSSGSSLAENSVGPDVAITNGAIVGPTTAADSEADNTTAAPNIVPANHVAPANNRDVSTGVSHQPLASLDASQLQEIRMKILRKNEIQAGLPSLDAEIRKSQAKLAEFKQEEGIILLEIARGQEGRRQLVEELENLGYEINGVSLEELDAAQHQSEIADPQPISDEATTIPPPSSVHNHITPHVSAFPSISQDESDPIQDAVPAGYAPEDTVELPSSQSRNADTGDVEYEKEPSPSSLSESTGSAMDESDDSSSADSTSVAHASRESPELAELSAPEPLEHSQEADQEEENGSGSVDGSHSLPARPRFPNADSQDELPESDSQAEQIQHTSSRESSLDSEAYEPPEPEPNPGSPESVESIYTPPLSLASPGPVEHTEASRPPLDQLQADEPLTGKVQGLETGSQNHVQVGVPDHERQPEAPERKFTPYSSPLKYFKAYRYHPAYTDDVSDGYRSLTYSHNIDPMKYLCPFEAAGGVCNDRSCEFQHFRDMTLSDDKILVQMGSLREGKSPEEKDHYIAGLKQIINDMRRDKVKDFNTVATEIAAYRRRFLQDPSRVLPL
ncbi:hypothetical protein MW887_011787 [Aspergillus wentii]|nr:hypothetical protein MW887_011787 [Aspergillus wentii]